MEMTYDGALVMPANFVAVDEEEMMYIDGGLGCYNWLVAGAINLAIDCIVVGGIRKAGSYFTSLVRRYGKCSAGLVFSRELRNSFIRKGIASRIASGICSIAAAGVTILCWAVDPGGSLASWIDSRDCRPNNGCCDVF